MIEDQCLFELLEQRLKNELGNVLSFEEVLAQDGLTFDEIDSMEDVDIE